jgi:Domain of unknown function (DUF4291)
MNLTTEPYLTQTDRWPKSGQVILANYDADSIVVYQAYNPAIGHFAATHQYFGGDFKLSRMTWLKPNFLWMMYRSGWGTKKDQEITLAIRLKRSAFDQILAQAVHSKYIPELYDSEKTWAKAIQTSEVRLQWDPDHSPTGGKLTRRAIQLGLQGDAARCYAQDWIVSIEDISAFVADQHQHVVAGNYGELQTPKESIYVVENREVADRLQLT